MEKRTEEEKEELTMQDVPKTITIFFQ